MFLIVKELVKGEVVKGAKAPNAARQARRLIRKGPVRVALAEEKEKKRVKCLKTHLFGLKTIPTNFSGKKGILRKAIILAGVPEARP